MEKINNENQDVITTPGFHIARSRKVSSKQKRTSKKDDYFGEVQELAIKKYLDPNTPNHEKLLLYIRVIEPAFIKLAKGALTLPQGQAVNFISKQELFEETLVTLKEVLIKYDPEKYRDENGKLPKAYSFFNTCASNFLKGFKRQQQKANLTDSLNSNPVEKFYPLNGNLVDYSLIDKEYNLVNKNLESNDSLFYLLDNKLNLVINKIENLLELLNNPSKKKSDKKKECKEMLGAPSLNANELKICKELINMLKDWHNINFDDKKEFREILEIRTGEKKQIIARTIKKIKNFVIEELNNTKI